MQQLLQLYKDTFHASPAAVEQLPRAGSNRRYVRLRHATGGSVIGVVGPDVRENACFVYLSQHFGSKGLGVPAIYAVSDDGACYLQTDLGTRSLYDALRRGREAGGEYGDDEVALLRRTVRELARVQVLGAEGIDGERLLPPVRFDAQAAMFDLNYFKYCFLRTTDLSLDEPRLEGDLQRFAADLSEGGEGACRTFLYRDFQARNVMLTPEGEPRFIDYQGGSLGPVQYDVASFLYQASARYPQTLREELIDVYLSALSELVTVDADAFRARLQRFVLFRILQVLGAYGLRGYFERKKYFIDSIPLAIQNLRRQLLEGVCADYPCLSETLRRMVDLPQFNAPAPCRGEASLSPHDGQGQLVVTVCSFSYKKGLPPDPSGNGGGYVFDCRAVHNPGRYERYRALTGLDEPVIQFLEDDGEILSFLDCIYRLAEAHVARYLQRGFTSLRFAFGCTGGRHRSVYGAEHLAEHLHQKFGVAVRLHHIEQGIERLLPAREAQ